jgi:hypothetical protein
VIVAIIKSRINLPIKTKTRNFLTGKRAAPARIPIASKKGFGIKEKTKISKGVCLWWKNRANISSMCFSELVSFLEEYPSIKPTPSPSVDPIAERRATRIGLNNVPPIPVTIIPGAGRKRVELETKFIKAIPKSPKDFNS